MAEPGTRPTKEGSPDEATEETHRARVAAASERVGRISAELDRRLETT